MKEFEKITMKDVMDFLKTLNIECDGVEFNGKALFSSTDKKISVKDLEPVVDEFSKLANRNLSVYSGFDGYHIEMNSINCVMEKFDIEGEYRSNWDCTKQWRKFLKERYGEKYVAYGKNRVKSEATFDCDEKE